MNDVTILYYTASREDEQFERRIRDHILKNSHGLQIVSVSQKKIDFGENICVGERTHSYYTEFRQIQIGLQEIKTKWVLTAESDVLCPPEYFSFVPSEDWPCWRYSPVYVNFMRSKPKVFYLKGLSDGLQLLDKSFWLKKIDDALGTEINWDTFPNFDTKSVQPQAGQVKIWEGNPAITFKTGKNVGEKTGYHQHNRTENLPFWGTIDNIKANYL